VTSICTKLGETFLLNTSTVSLSFAAALSRLDPPPRASQCCAITSIGREELLEEWQRKNAARGARATDELRNRGGGGERKDRGNGGRTRRKGIGGGGRKEDTGGKGKEGNSDS